MLTMDLFSEETKSTITSLLFIYNSSLSWGFLTGRGEGVKLSSSADLLSLGLKGIFSLSCWKDFLLSQDREDAISISHTTILRSSYFIVDFITGSDRNGLRWSFKVQGRVKRPQLIFWHRDYNSDSVDTSANHCRKLINVDHWWLFLSNNNSVTLILFEEDFYLSEEY